MDVIEQILQTKVVPVVAIDDADRAADLGAALVAGNLPIAEVTFRTAAAEASIASMSQNSQLLVGAGTVISPAQVDTAVDAGAKFVVSPGLSSAVVKRCTERGVPVFPGAVTASEVMAALELGIDTVKFFPASTNGGAAAIKALSAPFGQVRFIPTGGVSVDNLSDYFAVKSVIAVGGSWMVGKDLINSGDFDQIAQIAAAAVTRANELRP